MCDYASIVASSFATGGFCFRTGKFSSRIESVGHTGAHLRHNRHLSSSINARLFLMVMASNSHTFSHLLHPIQATAHAFLANAPLSSFTQLTNMRLDLGPCFLSSMISLGQAFHMLHTLCTYPPPLRGARSRDSYGSRQKYTIPHNA